MYMYTYSQFVQSIQSSPLQNPLSDAPLLPLLMSSAKSDWTGRGSTSTVQRGGSVMVMAFKKEKERYFSLNLGHKFLSKSKF